MVTLAAPFLQRLVKKLLSEKALVVGTIRTPFKGIGQKAVLVVGEQKNKNCIRCKEYCIVGLLGGLLGGLLAGAWIQAWRGWRGHFPG